MKALESLFNRSGGKLVLLGVGNPLRGDDGAGPKLVRELKNKIDAILLDCEEVPENFLGEIVKAQPDTVIIIDAVDLEKSPGSIAVLEEASLVSTGWSTHRVSLRPFIRYVKTNTEADVFVLGIQPKAMELGGKISDEVAQTLNLLKHLITKNFRR